MNRTALLLHLSSVLVRLRFIQAVVMAPKPEKVQLRKRVGSPQADCEPSDTATPLSTGAEPIQTPPKIEEPAQSPFRDIGPRDQMCVMNRGRPLKWTRALVAWRTLRSDST